MLGALFLRRWTPEMDLQPMGQQCLAVQAIRNPGNWRVESGYLDVGAWKLESGVSRSEIGTWNLEVGVWSARIREGGRRPSRAPGR